MTKVALKRSDRWTGAVLAILVQAGFLTLLVASRTQPPPPAQLVRELVLFLPRLTLPKAQPAPTTIDARGNPRPAVPAPAIPFIALRPAAPATTAPPPDLSGLGQSIFGCAPESWSSLSPEQRSKCPRPGEGMTGRNAPDLLAPPRNEAKDEAFWQEQWDEEHWTPAPCPAGAIISICLLRQAVAEHQRAQKARERLATQKAESLREPTPQLPERVGVHPE